MVARGPASTTLTLTGTVVAGQSWTVKLDTDTNEQNGYAITFSSYTSTGSDTLTTIAQHLAQTINSHANYNATNTGAKITITGQTSADVITRLTSTVAEPLVSSPGTVTSDVAKTSWVVR